MMERVELWGSVLAPHSREHFNMFYKRIFEIVPTRRRVIGELGEDLHIESNTYFELE
jgi:hypothetical protein